MNEFFPGRSRSFGEVFERNNVRMCVRVIVLGKNIVLINIRKNKRVDEFIPRPTADGFECERVIGKAVGRVSR